MLAAPRSAARPCFASMWVVLVQAMRGGRHDPAAEPAGLPRCDQAAHALGHRDQHVEQGLVALARAAVGLDRLDPGLSIARQLGRRRRHLPVRAPRHRLEQQAVVGAAGATDLALEACAPIALQRRAASGSAADPVALGRERAKPRARLVP